MTMHCKFNSFIHMTLLNNYIICLCITVNVTPWLPDGSLSKLN